MTKFQTWLLNGPGVFAGRAFFRALMSTVRVRYFNGRQRQWQYNDMHKSGIYCFWHGNLFVPYHYHRHRRVHIVISQHRDGEFISRIAEKGGYIPVRGSSTRGGARAMKEMLGLMEEGAVIAFTPDGPRGPKHQFKDGPIYLAQATSAPIYMMGVGFSDCWTMHDWSGLKVPKPFSKVCIYYGEPFHVPADLPEAEYPAWREKLSKALNDADAEATRIAQLPRWSE